MRKAVFAASICGSMLLSACATILPSSRPGSELAGQSLRVETSGGQTSTLHLNRGGVVRAVFGSNAVTGRWQVQQQQLCFFWTGAPRECWRYETPFRRGRTESVTSDRGNVVRVTLL